MLDPKRCWQTVCARDASYDGQFVFAVHSTGIYCRPSCPARRPLRHNVSFFADAASAATAGFRPCKRCSPHGQSPSELLDDVVASACQLLSETEQPLTLDQLASRIGLSPSHLARAFKARTGLTPRAWAAGQRRLKLENHLNSSDSVMEAAMHAGYADTRALYKHSGALKPAQRRQKGAGLQLRYAISECPLGYLLLAATEHGVCALLFGDSPAALEAEFAERFINAERLVDQHGLADWLHQVVQQLQQPSRAAHLPLDLQGSAFQIRVWQALQSIKPGETRQYGQLANQLDSHARAVARACASNPVGLLVPCHRVIAANGALTGYRWGIARKAQLLADEQIAAKSPQISGDTRH